MTIILDTTTIKIDIDYIFISKTLIDLQIS